MGNDVKQSRFVIKKGEMMGPSAWYQATFQFMPEWSISTSFGVVGRPGVGSAALLKQVARG